MKSLAIVKPGSLGDIVHALPVAAALRRSLPQTRILWVSDSRWAPLLEACPVVDEVVRFDRDNSRGPLGWLRAIRWAWRLRFVRPEAAWDLQGLLRSALIARAMRPRRVFGLMDAREGSRWLYDAAARVQPGEHSVWRYLHILQFLGIPCPSTPEFPLPAGSVPAPTPGEPFLLVAPTARGAGKSLGPEVLEEICRLLAPWPIVVTGPPGEAPALQHVINLRGRTSLLELVGLTRAAAAVLSVDSAPAHLAAALHRPLLAIHTWSDPRRVGPFSRQAWIWQSGRIHPAPGVEPQDARPPRLADAPLIAHKLRELLGGA